MKAVPGSKRRHGWVPQPHNGEGGVGGGGLSLHDATLSELWALQERFPVPGHGLLPHAMALLLHEQATLRGELRAAHELGLLLRGVSRPPALTAAAARGHEVGAGGGAGLEAYVEGLLQWCLGLAETGRASECVGAAERLAAFCERKSACGGCVCTRCMGPCIECMPHSPFILYPHFFSFVPSGLPWHHMRALLLLARAHLHACPADPCAPLPPLLRCLTLAETFDADPLHALASLALAQVHLRLGAPTKARALLKAALPTLLEHAPVREQGEAWLLLAKCHLLEVRKVLILIYFLIYTGEG